MNHPNIIKLQGVYESRTRLYIVMEKLVGGELFERIVGRPRFSEDEAGKLIRPILESIAYLHDLGIVHRDLKPENILCGENLDDIKIADFGLSKVESLNPSVVDSVSVMSRCFYQRKRWMRLVAPSPTLPLKCSPCKAMDKKLICGQLESFYSLCSAERSASSISFLSSLCSLTHSAPFRRTNP